MTVPQDFLAHISEEPWSKFTSSDYSPEQWHAACLIHQHDGAPTSKGQCKLPVKTPNGTLNRAGVKAAAAALAGARGGVDASPEEKEKAARALRGYYKQLDEEPPESLTHKETFENFLSHFGVKGMRWGVRRTRAQIDADSEDVTKVKTAKAVISKNRGSTDPLSNKELQDVVTRMNLEQQYSRLSARPSKPAVVGRRLQTGMKVVNGVLSAGEAANKAINFVNSPAGKKLKDQFEKK